MNVFPEPAIAIKTLYATTLLDHLLAGAILASLEMEPSVKVCSIFPCHEVTVNYQICEGRFSNRSETFVSLCFVRNVCW